MKIFRLPDLGEGLAEAEIRQWHVSEGEEIQADALMLSVETAKAVVDVPAPRTGRIQKLHGKIGDIIKIGEPLVEFTDGKDLPSNASEDAGSVVGNLKVQEVVLGSESISQKQPRSSSGQISALPSARMLARRAGISIDLVSPSGADGIVTPKDVEAYLRGQEHQAPQEGYEPLRGVRRAMAAAMTQSRQEVCPATVMDQANVASWQQQDFTFRLVRAVSVACKAEPALNAWYDGKTNARKLWSEIHIGLALDSEEGLFVPVIRNAGSLALTQVRAEVDRFKREIKDRTLSAEEFREPTILLSNFGSIAGQHATPVVVPPTVAILAVGKKRESFLPLSLSFDHRAVTGGEAARFLGALIKDLELP